MIPDIFERAAKGDDYTCRGCVCLTPDGKACKPDDLGARSVLRQAGEKMSAVVAAELHLDELYPAEPAPTE